MNLSVRFRRRRTIQFALDVSDEGQSHEGPILYVRDRVSRAECFGRENVARAA